MQPEARMPGSSGDWLRYAKADLALARVPLPQGGLYELLCFHAPQAAEKSVKLSSYTMALSLLEPTILSA